jgi:hypothetical protein
MQLKINRVFFISLYFIIMIKQNYSKEQMQQCFFRFKRALLACISKVIFCSTYLYINSMKLIYLIFIAYIWWNILFLKYIKSFQNLIQIVQYVNTEKKKIFIYIINRYEEITASIINSMFKFVVLKNISWLLYL